MRFKILVSFLGLALIISAAGSAQAQDEEEAVRGSFLTTRVKSSSSTPSSSVSATIAASAGSASKPTSSSKPSTKSSGKTTKKPTGKTSTHASASGKASTGKTTVAVKGNAAVDTNAPLLTAYSPSAIGLGYTLYMRDENGSPMRVDPSREFRAGDRIRISMESNTDGYLYIFHTENNGEPQMLYPDVRLENGANKIEAHVPYEIPWNEPGVENWFKFDANPANERLYIIVSRQPLPGIPTDTALVNYCGQSPCPWRPPVGVWAQVKANVEAKVGVVKGKSYGQKQTQTEQVAVTRGLGLDQTAPEPSVIRMNVSSNAPILVTAVDLIHR